MNELNRIVPIIEGHTEELKIAGVISIRPGYRLENGWPTMSVERHALVHGDYWPGNILWRRARLVGVIDWETPRLGDPGQDVGTCCGDINMLFGRSAADRFVAHYIEAGGEPGPDLHFWKLLYCAQALRDLVQWLPGLHAMRRTDLTLERARAAVSAFARAALDGAMVAG